MPTIDQAIVRLRNIEERKQTRRTIQVEQARLARETKGKRKAEEPDEGGEAGESEPLRKKITNGKVAENHAQKEDPLDAASKTFTRESSEVSRPAQVSDIAGVASTTNSRSKPEIQEDIRFTYVKPAAQTRGHTSYLTFAFLLPPAPLLESQSSDKNMDSYAMEYCQLPDQELVALIPPI